MPELALKIVTEGADDAKRKLGDVEKAVQGVEKAVGLTDQELSSLKDQLKKGVDLKQITLPTTEAKRSTDQLKDATQKLGREKDILAGKLGLTKQALVTQTAVMLGLNQQQLLLVRGAGSIAQTMGVATTPALLGVSAAAAGLLAGLTAVATFMAKSVQTYITQSGLLEQHRTAIEGVQDAWNDLFFEVGRGIIGHGVGVQRGLAIIEKSLRLFTDEIEMRVMVVRTLLGAGIRSIPGIGDLVGILTTPTRRTGDMDLVRGAGLIDPRLLEGPPEHLKPVATAAGVVASAAERAAAAFARWQAPLDAARARLLQTAGLIGQSVNLQLGAAGTPFGNVFFGPGIPSTPVMLQGRNLSGMATLPGVSGNFSSAPGGGSFFGNVFGGIGGSLKNMWQGMSGGKGMAGLFSNIGGGLLTGGLNTLMNAGIGLLGKGLGKLFGFGKSQEEKENEEATKQLKAFTQEWLKTNGGLERARTLADAFGISLDTALNQKGKRGLETAKTLLGQVDERQAKLKAAMEKYGIGVEQLGMKFKQLAQNDWAEQLLSDFEILTDAGLAPKEAIEAMSGELNKFVQRSMLMGTEVPNALRPILEIMLQMGLLVDANGVKLEDLSQIKFSETMTEGFDRVVAKLEELLIGLGIKLPEAARQGAAGVNDALDGIQIPDFGGGGGDDPEVHTGGYIAGRGRVLRFHRGGGVPALLEPGEFVLQRSAVNRIGVGTLHRLNQGGGLAATVVVNINASGSIFDNVRSADQFSQLVDDAISRRFRRTYRTASR